MEISRYAAFTIDPAGGNPAGVVLDARGATVAEMLQVAVEVGYSETAFLTPRADGAFDVRYFSPLGEVSFCGHATIATAVAYAEHHGPGEMLLHTSVGRVPVSTVGSLGAISATLTSVEPRSTPLADGDLAAILATLGWKQTDLDDSIRPGVAFAGAWHTVLVTKSRERLATLDYDYEALAILMGDRGWTTVNLVHQESESVFHARNPFPPGGVVEDPATGAAAAALGGYLRELCVVQPPATVTIHQGEDMGRPSLLTVDIPKTGGIRVTGTAVAIA